MGWEARLRAATITLWIAFLLYPALSAETGRGTICVLPNSAEPPTLVSPGGSYNPDTLMLRIDKRQAVPWPHKKGLKIEGLDLKERHFVVLLSDGKRIQSSWFRFSDFKSADLSIAFDGYQGVQLHEARGTPWCKCK
jgi:hypothetical protein